MLKYKAALASLKCKGVHVTVDGHNIHVYSVGDTNKPQIVLMSGSGTVAPVYDFKILYGREFHSYVLIRARVYNQSNNYYYEYTYE